MLVAAAALCGCGGRTDRAAAPEPKLPRPVAERLEVRSDEIARLLDTGDQCGALDAAHALQQETIAAINGRRVPAALQEPLASAAARVVARIHCAPQSTTLPTPPQAVPLPAPDDKGKKEHGHNGHGKHGHDKGDGDD